MVSWRLSKFPDNMDRELVENFAFSMEWETARGADTIIPRGAAPTGGHDGQWFTVNL